LPLFIIKKIKYGKEGEREKLVGELEIK